jgi:hypothetical protein
MFRNQPGCTPDSIANAIPDAVAHGTEFSHPAVSPIGPEPTDNDPVLGI